MSKLNNKYKDEHNQSNASKHSKKEVKLKYNDINNNEYDSVDESVHDNLMRRNIVSRDNDMYLDSKNKFEFNEHEYQELKNSGIMNNEK